MTDTLLALGSLSNDLMRVASLTFRGSETAAERFLQESTRWTRQLSESQPNQQLPPYITKIVQAVDHQSYSKCDLAKAEQLLMYGILLQNYCAAQR